MDNFSCYLLVTGNWWWVIINLKNYSSTGWENSIALALSAIAILNHLHNFCRGSLRSRLPDR
ncbi:MAG: hypothetical protein EAZ49_02625 [Oscillatoriales cyanobacterium]|nr:MAG: hypothetical protein EAZ49_02625 [Oscillatoriales cyanobacterium]